MSSCSSPAYLNTSSVKTGARVLLHFTERLKPLGHSGHAAGAPWLIHPSSISESDPDRSVLDLT